MSSNRQKGLIVVFVAEVEGTAEYPQLHLPAQGTLQAWLESKFRVHCLDNLSSQAGARLHCRPGDSDIFNSGSACHQAKSRERPNYGAAGLALPRHPTSQGACRPERLVVADAQLFLESSKNTLRSATVALFVIMGSFCGILRRHALHGLPPLVFVAIGSHYIP